MTFEELSEISRQTGPLFRNHPLYHFEEKLLNLLSGKDGERMRHELEHEAMLQHFGLPQEEVKQQLSHLDGIPNRAWHILLHCRYWKDNGLNSNLLTELDSQHPEINLDAIPLPRATGERK